MSQAPLLVHQLMDYPRSRNGDDNDNERKRRLKLDFLFTFWRIIQEQGVSSTSSTLHTIRMINTDLVSDMAASLTLPRAFSICLLK